MASSALVFGRSLYIGNIMAAILYGIQLYITFESVYYLIVFRNQNDRTRIFYVGYGIVMLICMTFAMAANALMGQRVFVEKPGYPGGPAAYYEAKGKPWFNVLGCAMDLLGNFLGDGLLLYRCYMIWGSNRLLITFPALVYAASTVTAVLSVVESALPGSSFFQSQATSFGIPWIALTCAYNVMMTALIVTRILRVQHQVKSSALSSERARMYTGIVAILVESALPFTILGIAFAVILGKNLPTEVALAAIWGSFVGLAPQLIILRVSMGRAWSKETVVQLTCPGPITFAPPPALSIEVSQLSSSSAPTTVAGVKFGKFGQTLAPSV
ncbi:hypothetical protein NEOLEDRAFT_1069387 [Neolentinus lepideus HHB14362 ss-1]|uniref:Uncharacterized protein n=1 Tax=Neolentinus lepideus HHB14362 ss-1 TaxID=1314782 RepID=A0A165RBW8_9AGAM|nr:hypothetical protein NEOLEDRAFT_1069387 [Neolentinus lepideus HHB14362 ss-1]